MTPKQYLLLISALFVVVIPHMGFCQACSHPVSKTKVNHGHHRIKNVLYFAASSEVLTMASRLCSPNRELLNRELLFPNKNLVTHGTVRKIVATVQPKLPIKIIVLVNVAVTAVWWGCVTMDVVNESRNDGTVTRSFLDWMGEHFTLRKQPAPRLQLPPALPPRRPHTWLTSAFSHLGPSHLVGNMWWLWNIGPDCVALLGYRWFAYFYMASIYAAQWLADCTFTSMRTTISKNKRMGASGAICSLITFFCLSFPRARLDICELH